MIKWFKKISSRFKKDGNFFFDIEKVTGFKPRSSGFYELALRHSSASRENKGRKFNNQRLEFLGDAILGAVVANYLYEQYPKAGEGFLTSMRSKIVSRKHMNQLAIQIGLHKMLVKKTPRNTHAKSIYGDAIEALIGAIYLDRGYRDCQTFIEEKVLKQQVDLKKLEHRIASHKGALLEWGQKNKRQIVFDVTGCWGESHARKYEITILLDGKALSTGKGTSKKRAEEEAARLAYQAITEESS
ncbi:MAG: ribonuclease III [Owenweeksia sp.]